MKTDESEVREIDNLRARVAEMETERRRLTALVESSPVGVLVVDAATRTLAWVNREAERILGMSPEPGTSLVRYHEVAIYRRTNGEKYESRERPLARALDRGEVVRAEEILFDLPGGRKVTTLINATPIYSDDGRIVSAIAVIQDMTPLEEVERLRNDFLAMVSHELRTPLTTIKGCTSVVLGSSDPVDISEMLQYFRMIDEQSDNLRSLVNNLLDMTRIEEGALSVTPKPTDIVSLIEEAKAAFLRRGARNTVEVDLDPDLPLVAADGRRMTQVMDNLLSNASKYSLEPSTIRVTGSRDGVHVAISVTDEGRGIPSEHLAGLFRKFSRVDGGEGERKVAGEGLGLAICKGIVEAHGGRIRADSEGRDRGTRITFTIPEAAEADQGAHRRRPGLCAGRPGPGPRGRRRAPGPVAAPEHPLRARVQAVRGRQPRRGDAPAGDGAARPCPSRPDAARRQRIRADGPRQGGFRSAHHIPVRERPGGERGEGPLDGGRRLHDKAILYNRVARENRIVPAKAGAVRRHQAAPAL